MNYEELYTLAEQVEERLQPVFRGFERTAEKNTKRVLDAFRAHRVSEPCFAGTTGYGYDDLGRWRRSMPMSLARKRRLCAPRL